GHLRECREDGVDRERPEHRQAGQQEGQGAGAAQAHGDGAASVDVTSVDVASIDVAPVLAGAASFGNWPASAGAGTAPARTRAGTCRCSILARLATGKTSTRRSSGHHT